MLYVSVCVLCFSLVEYDTIADTPGEKEILSQYKENINSAVQAQFNDIVEEVGRLLHCHFKFT